MLKQKLEGRLEYAFSFTLSFAVGIFCCYIGLIVAGYMGYFDEGMGVPK